MRLSSFDAFTKVDEAFLGRSASGGYISIGIWITLLLLSLTELSNFLSVSETTEFAIEGPVKRTMSVNLDITVAMPCNEIKFSFADKAGVAIDYGSNLRAKDVKFSTENTILHKKKSASSEDFIEERAAGNLLTLVQQIGNVLEGSVPKSLNGNIPFSMEGSDSSGKENPNLGKGCRISGRARLLRLAESFQISGAGESIKSSVPVFERNFTHRIDWFSFGSEYVRIQLKNPLARSLELSNLHFESFNYFLSIVPTTIYRHGRTHMTSQFAVTEYSKVSKGFEIFIQHGITFKFSYEPIMVKIIQKSREGFFRFLVRMCGIIGGVYVCAGIIHSVFSSAVGALKKRDSHYVKI